MRSSLPPPYSLPFYRSLLAPASGESERLLAKCGVTYGVQRKKGRPCRQARSRPFHTRAIRPPKGDPDVHRIPFYRTRHLPSSAIGAPLATDRPSTPDLIFGGL